MCEDLELSGRVDIGELGHTSTSHEAGNIVVVKTIDAL
jgi:hypothetical protein